MDLKQNALHNLWISPHKHCKSNQFFTTNAQKGIYFFIYNVVCDTALWIFSYLRVIIVHQTQTILWPKKKLLLPL